MYLSRLIKPAQIKVTRLAHGLAVGSDIEYADEMTLARAMQGRQEMWGIKMFGLWKKQQLKKQYDEMLLADIDTAKRKWDNARQTQAAVYDSDEQLVAETELAKAKYYFLYLEAKRRQIKGHIQSSVIDHWWWMYEN